MKNPLLLILIMFFTAVTPVVYPAADINEEETTEKYLGKAEEKAYKKVEVEKQGQRYKTKLLLSAVQGYDNNVFLDPRREHDTFSEGILDASVTYPLNGRWDLTGEVSAHDITYWRATAASLVDTDLILGLEGKLIGGATIKVFNDIELVEYVKNDDGEYLGDKAGFVLKQKLPKNFFHSLKYEYFYKNYSDRKAMNGWGGLTNKDRVDNRNTIYYDAGFYLKKAMFKGFGEYYINRSNDNYLDYYDYESVRVGCSTIYLLTSKMSAYLSYYRQFRNYDARTIPGDNTQAEKDRTWVATTSLFYDFSKNVSLGLNYSYRQNLSNYPAQKYSGSITSMGLYCRF